MTVPMKLLVRGATDSLNDGTRRSDLDACTAAGASCEADMVEAKAVPVVGGTDRQ